MQTFYNATITYTNSVFENKAYVVELKHALFVNIATQLADLNHLVEITVLSVAIVKVD